jgi:large subunit ribosomal protein L35
MPKMKTNRAAAKRLRRTASGKVRRYRAYGNHLMTSKSPARRRRLRKPDIVADADRKSVAQLLPYSRTSR